MEIKCYKASPKAEKLSKRSILKRILAFAYICFPLSYFFVFLHSLFIKRCRRNYKYEVSLCLIFRNEAPYLKEWIEYHCLIGIDHFYLYNNFSDDNYMDVLRPYIESGLVTLIQWPHQFAQVAAYEDCHNRVKEETHWLGYIDADEFINLQEYNNIKELLHVYKSYPALYLYWRMFGTSGFIKEPEKYLVTENYTASWSYLCNTGKTIINNDYQNFCIGVHQSRALVWHFPIYPIDDKKLFNFLFFNPFSFLRNYSPKVYVNHYWSRSYEFYKYKDFSRGAVSSVANAERKKIPGRFEFHELNNKTHDYSIQRWLTLLKIRMIK